MDTTVQAYFKSTPIDDEEYQDNKLELKNIDEPQEISALISQWIMATIILLLGVPFTPTYDLFYYENLGRTDPSTFTYNWWWIGLLFLVITLIFTYIFMIQKNENHLVAFIRLFLSIILFFILGTIMNSLWMYGTFIYDGYFLSYKHFFTSSIIVSMITGILVVGILGFVPISFFKKPKKNESFLKYCYDYNTKNKYKYTVCNFPGYEEIRLIKKSIK